MRYDHRTVKGTLKKALTTLTGVLLAGTALVSPAMAGPSGGVVTHGGADIVGQGSDAVTINQNTNRVVIDWQNFDTQAHESVNFNQIDSNSIALNRILSGSPTQFNGALNANGNVIVMNANGVVFGSSSRVDVNGLIATTADVSTDSFMNDAQIRFDQIGNPNASIINHGTITAKEAGLVGFVAPHVENSGTIIARLGKVQLESGDRFTFDLYGDGLIEIAASDAVNAQLVANSGTITADGGVIQLQASAAKNVVDALVSNTGILEAHSVHEQNGMIMLGGDTATTRVSGRVDVSGIDASTTGGRIEMTGKNIAVENATIDASGHAGGGDIRIGGGYKGGEDIYHAKTTNVDIFTAITADATQNGDGGTIVVWSDDMTDISAKLSAKGGLQSGDGGLIETSGKTDLRMTGSVDASAAHGAYGTWLVDPANITINAAAGASDGVNTFNRTYLEAQLANIILSADTNITLSLSGETVVLQNNIGLTLNAGQDILTTSAGTIRASGTGSVVFAAIRDVRLTHALNVQATGTGSVTFRAGRQISSTLGGGITTQGGDIILNADRDEVGGGNIVLTSVNATSNGGDIVLGGGDNPYTKVAQGYSGAVIGVTLGASTLNSGTGDISIRGAGYSAGVGASNQGVYLQTASLVQSTSGSIMIHGRGGNGTTTNYGVYIFSPNTRISSVNGSISITGIGGNGTTNNNFGYYQNIGTIVESTGTGADAATITIIGTGGSGTTSNQGIQLNGANTRISSIDGNISISGTGGSGTGTGSYGYYQNNGAVIESTGMGANAAMITITGTSINGSSNNHGVSLAAANTRISSIDGNISISGTGGSGTTGSIYGYSQSSGAIVESTGMGADAATITITGTGGNAPNNNHGVNLLNARISSIDGNIWISGTGGNSAGSSNIGYIQGAAIVESTGVGAHAATITIIGTGGSGTITNYGFQLSSANARISSIDGDISISGTAGNGTGNGNNGYYQSTGAIIQSTGMGADAAAITIAGMGGRGTTDNHGVILISTNTRISSIDGNISISGTAGNATGIGNYGYYQSSALIQSTGMGAEAATITITGTGGSGASSRYGVYVDSSATRISSVDGNISISGTGGNGTGNSNYGYYQNSGAIIESTGMGTYAAMITITGTGGSGPAAQYGVYINGANTRISSIDGNISLTGQGGNGTSSTNYGYLQNTAAVVESTGIGADAATITISGTGGTGTATNHGVYVLTANTRISSVDGDIVITGVGGNGTGNTNYGYHQNTAAVVQSTGTGNHAASITINGTGGAGVTNNFGVHVIAANTRISSVDGNISITGQGGAGTGNGNLGYYQATGAAVVSTGTDSNAATITISGTAHDSISENYGIIMINTNTRVASVNGAISFTGIGKGSGTSNYGYGQYLGAVVESTGTGEDAATITIDGTGADGTGALNFGVFLSSANTRLSSVDGNISITGLGGSGVGTNDYGYFQYTGAKVYSTGVGEHAATITITGRGGTGGRIANIGVYVLGPDTEINSVDGDITIWGEGGKSTEYANHGFLIEDSKIRSTGTGAYAADITIDGIAGTGNDNNSGLYVNTNTTEISTVDGNITLSGVVGTGTNTYGVYLNGAVQITTQNAASVMTFASDTSIHANNNPVVSAAGDILIRPMTSGNTLAIGSATGVSHEFINALTWGETLYLGGYNNVVTARTVSFEGDTVFNGTVLAQATNTMILSTGSTVTANATDDALTLSSLVFTNNAGANALSAPNGRWLVYSTSPNTDKTDGLTAQFKTFSCSYGAACALGVGNGYIYRNANVVLRLPKSVEIGRNASSMKPSLSTQFMAESMALVTHVDADGPIYNVDITHGQISSDTPIEFYNSEDHDTSYLMRNFYKVYFTKALLQQLGFIVR